MPKTKRKTAYTAISCLPNTLARFRLVTAQMSTMKGEVIPTNDDGLTALLDHFDQTAHLAFRNRQTA